MTKSSTNKLPYKERRIESFKSFHPTFDPKLFGKITVDADIAIDPDCMTGQFVPLGYSEEMVRVSANIHEAFGPFTAEFVFQVIEAVLMTLMNVSVEKDDGTTVLSELNSDRVEGMFAQLKESLDHESDLVKQSARKKKRKKH